jgi:pilus assembly protein CpaB
MKRRVLGLVAAVVLAAVGTTALVAYVRSARADAVAGEAQTEVVMVTDTVAQGAPFDVVRSRVRVATVPVRLVAPGAVTSLTDLDALFAQDPSLTVTGDLLAGDQLQRDRLAPRRQLSRAEVPEGLQELTIAVAPERAVGGELRPGDVVGVVTSLVDPEPISTLTLTGVPVIAVQITSADRTRLGLVNDRTGNDIADPTVADAPERQVLVTLAVTSAQAEELVASLEFGQVWFTRHADGAVLR